MSKKRLRNTSASVSELYIRKNSAWGISYLVQGRSIIFSSNWGEGRGRGGRQGAGGRAGGEAGEGTNLKQKKLYKGKHV